MNKQSLVRIFAFAPILILGLTAVISSQGFHPIEKQQNNYDHNSMALQTISKYADKASATRDKKQALRYLNIATSLIECIGTQEGRDLANEYIESARMETKVARPDREHELPTLS